MSLGWRVFGFALDSAFAYGVVWRGGARWLEGWKAWPVVGMWALRWDAEPIRLAVLLLWVLHSLWFLRGLVRPDWRW